jgi:hypothetical protein
MFINCTALEVAPAINTGKGTNVNAMFSGCTSLTRVPDLSTANVNAALGMVNLFSTCTSLANIGTIVGNAVPNTAAYATMFNSCTSLNRADLQQFDQTFTIAQCSFGAADLNNIFSNLATVGSGTITVTGNPGAATANTAIATGKGWTVTT